MKLNTFEFYDCWLLLSIGFKKEGATLKEILSSGDILNHCAFLVDELNYGMSKLIENGYVIKEKDRFKLTSKAIKFYESNKIENEGCIKELLRLSEIFVKEKANQNCKLHKYFSQDQKGKISVV